MDASGYLTTKSGKTLAVVSVILALVALVVQMLIIFGVIAAIGLFGSAWG